MTTIERSLVLVKPDGYDRRLTGQVLARIEAKGYRIVALEVRTADRELLDEHYAEHIGKVWYNGLADFMSSGPLVAVVIEGTAASRFPVPRRRDRPHEGRPGTIRGDFGRDWGTDAQPNIVHGSDGVESAAREIGLWFPHLS